MYIDSGATMGRIRVEDRGRGIAVKDIDMVFEPFSSGNNESSSGLGLAFCKSVVECNGGFIQIDNNTSTQGVTITIELPHATTIFKQRNELH